MTKLNGVFLSAMMEKMGFEERWIKLTMTCVSLVKYKVKVNGAY